MAYHRLVMGGRLGRRWEEMAAEHALAHTRQKNTQNSFEILFLSTKTIKNGGALMCSAALQVRRESVSLS